MNPYLEHPTVWPDFHESMIPAIRAMIAKQLGPSYRVRIEENVYIHEPSAEERLRAGKPDMSVVRDRDVRSTLTSTAIIEAPAFVTHPLPVDEVRLSYLAISDAVHRDVVTVIELLSPTNKRPGPDRQAYLDKRQRLLRSTAHLVELDLLRMGPRMPDADAPASDYLITVSRAERRPTAGVWPFGLRDPFPVVPIPLKAGDADVPLDLKPILDEVYDEARYELDIYDLPIVPPLGDADLDWAPSLLAAGRVS